MDVNGTRFHLLQGERDWLPLLVEQQADKIWWDRARQQLTLAPAILEIPASAGDAVYGPAQRRGASYDHYRNVYWLGPEQDRILYRPAATPNQVATFWSVDRLHDACERDAKASAFRPCQSSNDTPSPVLRGLTVTTREYLVVGTMQPAGLLVFGSRSLLSIWRRHRMAVSGYSIETRSHRINSGAWIAFFRSCPAADFRSRSNLPAMHRSSRFAVSYNHVMLAICRVASPCKCRRHWLR